MNTTTTADAPSLIGTDRAAQARELRATLDTAAAGINAFHAQVLAAVIDMKHRNLHRSAFGFSALRDLLLSQFDFTFNTAGAIAAIARLSGKFRILTEAATSGRARIDQVAYAVRQLDQTPAMRLFARTPFRAPVPSPFDPVVECATPEAMVAQYCQHAPFKDLQRHLEGLWATIAEESELLDALGEQSLQRLDLVETGNGMWHLEAELTATTGRLLDKYLKTACPPPRQDEEDGDGVLPPQANRHAEALHQLLAGYGSSPEAATRHGHTATLNLTVDIATLRGEDTGRVPLLDGDPISLAQARLLACETLAIPSVFDYESGEAVELGRALRLPNVALRRKLELEQPAGCAWHGCDRPVAWTEAHHIVHWADGGPTEAANLILVCRFHHGRLHTPGWTVTKTGPGRAIITHHDHHTTDTTGTGVGAGVGAGADAEAHGRNSSGGGGDTTGCGCADWRTDTDMDTEHADSGWDLFPTGLYRTEWSETLQPDLDGHAEMIERDRARAAIREARAKARARFTTGGSADRSDHSEQAPATTPTPPAAPTAEAEASSPREPALAGTATTARTVRPVKPVVPAGPIGPIDYGEPPFLPRPSRRLLGDARPHHTHGPQPEPRQGPGPPACPHPKPETPPQPTIAPSSPPALRAPLHHPKAESPAPYTTTPSSPPARTANGPPRQGRSTTLRATLSSSPPALTTRAASPRSRRLCPTSTTPSSPIALTANRHEPRAEVSTGARSSHRRRPLEKGSLYCSKAAASMPGSGRPSVDARSDRRCRRTRTRQSRYRPDRATALPASHATAPFLRARTSTASRADR
ncbi:HNH endonuclease [Glycomyces sp. A-F 0318]|uniref:HNH endonuclease signature motif containing protein n=1 Tax=Glycomyces amatae TaxID=2881355 RepID=UPI001E4B0D4F|nr:HNH endonuclease signature motif containing protein [Glycomyces amatae]MCD0445010.1 HNH endonuclease [Glycomyces amatae]